MWSCTESTLQAADARARQPPHVVQLRIDCASVLLSCSCNLRYVWNADRADGRSAGLAEACIRSSAALRSASLKSCFAILQSALQFECRQSRWPTVIRPEERAAWLAICYGIRNRLLCYWLCVDFRRSLSCYCYHANSHALVALFLFRVETNSMFAGRYCLSWNNNARCVKESSSGRSGKWCLVSNFTFMFLGTCGLDK